MQANFDFFSKKTCGWGAGDWLPGVRPRTVGKSGEQGHAQAYRMCGREPAAAHFCNASAPQQPKPLVNRALAAKKRGGAASVTECTPRCPTHSRSLPSRRWAEYVTQNVNKFNHN